MYTRKILSPIFVQNAQKFILFQTFNTFLLRLSFLCLLTSYFLFLILLTNTETFD